MRQRSICLQETSTSSSSESKLIIELPAGKNPIKDVYVKESHIQQTIDDTTLLLSVRATNKRSGFICKGYLSRRDVEFEVHLSAFATDHIDSKKEVDDASVHQFVSALHRLLLEYLQYEQLAYENERDGGIFSEKTTLKLVLTDDIDGELMKKLRNIGLRDEQPFDNNLGFDLDEYLTYLNDFIFRHRGTEQGNTALDVLKMLCQRRVPYDFSTIGAVSCVNQTIVSYQQNLLPSNTVESAMEIVNEIKTKRLLSMNPDSVDGLPSLHLNLISNGKPLFDTNESNKEKDASFEQCISRLTNILQPYLYNNLLPSVQKLLNSSTVNISDVFIRNYGHLDESDSSNEQPTRYTLSPHYDITAYATCVITLDSTAASGKNGLYTIPRSSKGSTNNAALRRFFPLNEGDGVVHTFDVLHGVDVDPDLKKTRTSLIIWFGNSNDEWLERTDDISQFVSGLVLEEEDVSIETLEMYISSAEQGNVFAMTALAQHCSDGKVPGSLYQRIKSIIPPNIFQPKEGTPIECNELANSLWYHSAIVGGNPVAQNGLANNIMSHYASVESDLSCKEKEHLLLMASVLFSMAFNNHHIDSLDALERLMGVECRRLHDAGIEIPSKEFFSSPVVKVLRLSLDREETNEE